MLKQLQQLVQQGKWAEVYDEAGNLEAFHAGRILGASDVFTILANVSPSGLYDGFSLIATNRIFQVSTDTKYLENVEKLYHKQQPKHWDWPVQKKDLLGSFLSFANEHSLIITVAAFEENLVQGFFKDIEKDVLVLAPLNYQGEQDGETRILLEAVSAIYCDHEGAQALKQLYELNK